MMTEDREFNNILDECLERLITRGETVDECLAGYPQLAAELRPLLLTAVKARRSLGIKPSPRFKAEARQRFYAALEEAKARKTLSFFSWRPRLATVAVSLVLALLLTSGSVAVASNGSMPGEFLYPVKLTVERVMLGLSFSTMAKAKTFAKLADRRVTEIVYLAQRGEVRQIELATERLDSHLVAITSLLATGGGVTEAVLAPSAEALAGADIKDVARGGGGAYSQGDGAIELEVLLGQYIVQHPAALSQALEVAPNSAKPALYQAIAVALAGYQNALDAIE